MRIVTQENNDLNRLFGLVERLPARIPFHEYIRTISHMEVQPIDLSNPIDQGMVRGLQHILQNLIAQFNETPIEIEPDDHIPTRLNSEFCQALYEALSDTAFASDVQTYYRRITFQTSDETYVYLNVRTTTVEEPTSQRYIYISRTRHGIEHSGRHLYIGSFWELEQEEFYTVAYLRSFEIRDLSEVEFRFKLEINCSREDVLDGTTPLEGFEEDNASV